MDFVLDTCTLVHANNPDSEYYESSIALIMKLLASDMKITVDDEFSLNETLNKSYIGYEYNKHLITGMLGYSLLVALASSDRFSFVSSKVDVSTKKYVERLVSNKKDRFFLKVTLNINDKILISHDFTDYTVSKRVKVKKDKNVSIMIADDFLNIIGAVD